ncbi:protein-disulfide reductase DsbD family protein [Qipengyuania sp. MTN3-11]|uniref:protein-disulfide reductase DsbD family protein n=1 Tax=Qipengyuania sp. MTN3-11 TaxID=3056557 RepID=UPI0036F3231A
MDGFARVAALVALLAALLLPSSLAAQDVRFGSENMAVELAADAPPRPGETWMLALHFSPRSEEWHGYWSNPGDAGLGMTLDWNLPPGSEVGEPLYPVPQRLVVAGLMNHVYKGDYTVLVPVAVPANAAIAAVPAIAVRAQYLACTDKVCVPQDAYLTLDPSAATGDERFAGWRAQVAPLLDREGSFAIADGRLRVAIPIPEAERLGDAHLFVENLDLVDYAAPQPFFARGNTLIAEIPLGLGEAPVELRGILAFGDGNGVRFTARAGPVPSGGFALAASHDRLPSVWLALLGALAGGLLLNLMPCVFPILSLKALALARAGGAEGAARRDALAYTTGVVLACVALGGVLLGLRAAGEQVGWAFQLQEPWVVVALLVLATAITANLAGAFELPGLVVRGGRGGTSSFATGLLAAFVATPCTGPFMAAAMGAALLLPAPQALALFAALGLGLALPFLLLGFVPALRALLPRPGAWMARFRKWMAVPMGLTALALAWLVWRMGGTAFAIGALAIAGVVTLLLAAILGGLKGANMRWAAAGIATFLLIGTGMGMQYGFVPQAEAAGDSIHDPEPFSEARLAEARASGRPVFVWFTADWCLTCKVNERAAIERAEVREAFRRAGVVTLRGDWTRRDEAITGFLTRQGAAGVPLYLWYPAGGEPRQLPQVLTPDLLAGLPGRGSR